MEMHTTEVSQTVPELQLKTDATKKKLEGDELIAALKKQILYYFSKENLQTDTYLASQMNNDMFVPIKVIAGFKMLKNLTEDVELITEVFRSLPDVTVDEQGVMVKPNIRAPRTTLIFREVPVDTQESEIEEFLLKEGCTKPTSIKSDIGQTWFVSFADEDEALKAFEVVRNTVFKGQIVHVRYKYEKASKMLAAVSHQPFYPKTFTNYVPSSVAPVGNGWNPDQNRRRHPSNNRHPRKDYPNQKTSTTEAPAQRREGENQQSQNENPQRGRINRPRSRNPRGDGQRQESYKSQTTPINIDGSSFPPLPGGNHKNEGSHGSASLPKQYSHVAVAVADKPVISRQPRKQEGRQSHNNRNPEKGQKTRNRERQEEDKENIKSEEKETIKELETQEQETKEQSSMSYAQILKSMNASQSTNEKLQEGVAQEKEVSASSEKQERPRSDRNGGRNGHRDSRSRQRTKEEEKTSDSFVPATSPAPVQTEQKVETA